MNTEGFIRDLIYTHVSLMEFVMRTCDYTGVGHTNIHGFEYIVFQSNDDYIVSHGNTVVNKGDYFTLGGGGNGSQVNVINYDQK